MTASGSEELNYIQELQDQLTSMGKGFMHTLPSLVIALAILLITFVAARSAVKIADRLTGRAQIRTDLKQLLDTAVRLFIWIIGLLIAATVAIPTFTPAGAFTGLGVGALAIGFAFQDIFENFLAGVLIMLREKMNIGDVIECQNILGRVEKITLRESHIRQLSNELTVVPNSMLFKHPVKILTDATVRRDEIVVGVSYDADLEQAQEVITRAFDSIEAIDRNRPILVAAQAFHASSIDFLVQWWANTAQRDLRLTKGEVVKTVKVALDDAGIEIPFLHVTHTFKEDVPVRQIVQAAGNDVA